MAGGEIDTGNDLGAGVFNLKTGVELEEEVLLGVWVVEILHRPCATIANEFSEANRVLKFGSKWDDHKANERLLQGATTYPLHGVKYRLWRDNTGSFFQDFLMSSLHGAVTAVQADGLTILIGEELDLQVSNVLHTLNDENRRLGDFILNLNCENR